jgi:rubrerythrin
MNPEHVQKLWHLRFLKVLELEEESFEFYGKLLREKGDLLEKAGIKSVLEQIRRDEGRHIKIARDLVRLVGRRG